VTQLAWDDGLDNEFAETLSAMREFHGGLGARDAALSRLVGEFQAVARDFESGSL
jgi:hypothetical protein